MFASVADWRTSASRALGISILAGVCGPAAAAARREVSWRSATGHRAVTAAALLHCDTCM